jgi:hypothetical protein
MNGSWRFSHRIERTKNNTTKGKKTMKEQEANTSEVVGTYFELFGIPTPSTPVESYNQGEWLDGMTVEVERVDKDGNKYTDTFCNVVDVIRDRDSYIINLLHTVYDGTDTIKQLFVKPCEVTIPVSTVISLSKEFCKINTSGEWLAYFQRH